MSVWFCSRRSVVAPLSGRSASVPTMKRRVQVMWSSHSLRMSRRSCSAFAGGAGAGLATPNPGAIPRTNTETGRHRDSRRTRTPFSRSLDRLQILDELVLLLIRQVETQVVVVVLDDRSVVGEAAVVVEARFRADEEAAQRGRAVELLVRRAARLEVVDAD